MYGFEALLRWHHPDPRHDRAGALHPAGRGHRPDRPDRPLDAQPGLPADGPAARRLPHDPPLTISVNLSVKQLQSDTIVGDVQEALRSSGLPASALVLEITESVMMADIDLAIARLQALKALGIKLAMDDFGTGYSSLSYLSRLPVDILKMDRSFLASGDAVSGLPAAIVALGESLDLEVVAEGIEQATQASLLRDLGCELGQGFLFAHAMNSPDLLRYLLALKTSAERPPQADAA